MTKYELTDETFIHAFPTGKEMVYQIRALKDIPIYGVYAGDLGGWISESASLSQIGNCWIEPHAAVGKSASILDDALIKGKSVIAEGSEVFGRAIVDDSEVLFNSKVSGNTMVSSSHLLSHCVIKNQTIVRESTLKNIGLVAGSVIGSKILAHQQDTFSFEAKTVFSNAVLEIHDHSATVEQEFHAEDVTLENLRTLQVFEHTVLRKVKAIGALHLMTGEEFGVGNLYSIVDGKQGLCVLDGAKLTLAHTAIEGEVQLSGIMTLMGCKVLDMASIRNETARHLSLYKVHLSELASIRKKDTGKDESLVALVVASDNAFVC